MAKILSKVFKDFKKLKLQKVLDFSTLGKAKQKIIKINLGELKCPYKKVNEDDLEPSHEVYLMLQGIAVDLAFEISDLKVMEDYYNKALELEHYYMPSFPPMSPITSSYYNFYLLADFEIGKDKETIIGLLYQLGCLFKFDSLVMMALDKLMNSSMAFYSYLGVKDGFVKLQNILTEEVCSVVCTSGYKGNIGELWFVRLCSNLDSSYKYSVTLTTPYVFLGTTAEDWKAFFRRQVKTSNEMQFEKECVRFIKQNKKINFWHDYILDSYANYNPNAIFLTGIPDVRESLPNRLDEDF